MSHTSRRRATAIGVLLATTAMAAACAPALAENASVKSMSIKAYNATQELHVISTDGKTWNAFKSGQVPFSADLSINTRGRGYVHNVGVALGHCGGDQCLSFPMLFGKFIIKRDWSGKANMAFAGNALPVSDQDSIAISPEGGEILSACNAQLASDGPTRKHEFTKTMTATFFANTDKIDFLSYIAIEVGESPFPASNDEWRHDTFNVKVVCDPVKQLPGQDVAAPQPDFKPIGVKLFLATFKGGNNNGTNPAAKCPALKVTTRVQASKAGGVDVRLWRKQGNGQATSTFKSAYASFDAKKNGYFADFVHTEKFDATTYLQFMAEAQGGTFAPSTPWKDITVHCTGAGGGGLANDMPNTGKDPLPPPKPKKPKPQVDVGSSDLAGQPQPGGDKPVKSWTGTVTLADSAAHKKRCPRKGQAVFAVNRNAPGTFKYKLSCNNGQGFSGSVLSYSQGGPNFEAYGAHDININRTRKIQCTLQEVKPSGARVTIDKGSFNYTCNNPAVKPDADDLAVPQTPPKPTHAMPKPEVSIMCKPGFKRVGKICVKKPSVSILCRKGFKQQGLKCVKLPRLVTRAKPQRARIIR